MTKFDDTIYIQDSPYQTVFVIGAGAWGTALANTAARAQRNVILWARDEKMVADFQSTGRNTKYLPDVDLEPNIQMTTDITRAIEADVILCVTPAQNFNDLLAMLPPTLSPEIPLILCSKGIDLKTGKMLSTLLEEYDINRGYAVLSGPSFASETVRFMPTAVAIASTDKDIARNTANMLSHKTFRPYITDDPIGAQISGAIKNVIAIACGIIHGQKMGDNARAALVTRGLQEIWRIGNAMGAKRKTFMGMSGMGDLMLTCSSMQSRNFSLGVRLGQGESVKDILSSRNSVTEGVYTAEAVLKLARKHAVDLPICEAVHQVLQGSLTVEESIEATLTRPIREES